MAGIDFQETLDRLRREFIDHSGERLDRIDSLIDRMFRDDGDRDSDFIEFQREIHSLKGSAGTYGFNSVTLIAHRIEDYIEVASRLTSKRLLDVQVHIDRIREILESGNEISNERLDRVLEALPSSIMTSAETDERRIVTVFLVMAKGVQRKLVTTELVSCGFELVFSDHPLEAFSLAISLKPDLIVSSVEFDQLSGLELARSLRAVGATADIPIVLMTSHDAKELQAGQVPDNTQVIHKDPDFAVDLANLLMKTGMIG